MRTRRRAFTLFELLLTLALLAIIAALAWPALSGPLANQRLRKSADSVRAAWGAARVRAIQSGQVHLFRYAPGSRQYVLELRRLSEADVDPAYGLPIEGAGPLRPSDDSLDFRGPVVVIQGALPEGITFAEAPLSAEGRTDTASPSDDPASRSSQAEQGWSLPISFYPDGTSSDARLTLRNEEGRVIDLALRGLTGVVRVGEVTDGR